MIDTPLLPRIVDPATFYKEVVPELVQHLEKQRELLPTVIDAFANKIFEYINEKTVEEYQENGFISSSSPWKANFFAIEYYKPVWTKIEPPYNEVFKVARREVKFPNFIAPNYSSASKEEQSLIKDLIKRTATRVNELLKEHHSTDGDLWRFSVKAQNEKMKEFDNILSYGWAVKVKVWQKSEDPSKTVYF